MYSFGNFIEFCIEFIGNMNNTVDAKLNATLFHVTIFK